MSTGSISLDILLNKILTDAISGGNESIRAIQKRYPSLSEKEAHEILAMVSATAQSNDDSAELVVCNLTPFSNSLSLRLQTLSP